MVLVPLAVNPLSEEGSCTAIQAKVVPATLEVKLTRVVGIAEHTDCVSGVLVTRAVGLTVIV